MYIYIYVCELIGVYIHYISILEFVSNCACIYYAFFTKELLLFFTRLYKYGQTFMHNTFESDTVDKNDSPKRSEPVLWDRTEIWRNLPELSYKEFMETDDGLFTWLDMFYKVRRTGSFINSCI